LLCDKEFCSSSIRLSSASLAFSSRFNLIFSANVITGAAEGGGTVFELIVSRLLPGGVIFPH